MITRLVLALLPLLAAGSAHAAIDADHADDVCAPAANPCLVNQVVNVADGVTLDFGTRTLSLTGAGQLDFGSGSATVRVGELVADTNAAAINARGPIGDGKFGSGDVVIEARRRCSAGINPPPCLRDADCSQGSCSNGSGSITIDGAVHGFSADPGSIRFDAAGDVQLEQVVDVSSLAFGDGGAVIVNAGGSVELSGAVQAWGADEHAGGSLRILAGLDATLHEEVSVNGGGAGGGIVEILAGRDIFVEKSLLAASTAADGNGGSIDVHAGRDFVLSSQSALFQTRLVSSAHNEVETFNDAGQQWLTAERDLLLGEDTRIVGNGAGPLSTAATFLLEAGRALVMNGELQASSDGATAKAGTLFASSAGTVTVGPAASFVFAGTGTGGIGGKVELRSEGNLGFAGSSDLRGEGNSLQLLSEGDLLLEGSLFIKDQPANPSYGEIRLEGCNVTMTGSGEIDQKAADGDSTVVARERMHFFFGSSMSAPTGYNTLIYRTPAKAPILAGSIDPDPTLIVDDTLEPCPICGNSSIEGNETCDDGDTASGDGCSADCVSEACIADTVAPGYPATSLCDDADPCTQDVCNAAIPGGGCEHTTLDCNDGVICTSDSCAAGVCVHGLVDSACDDDNACTDETCTTNGCEFVDNTNACDDGDPCTSGDTCTGGDCIGEDDGSCADCGDGEVTAPEVCDDGDDLFVNGQYCDELCELVPCGHPTRAGGLLPKASDALFTLRASVGTASCHPRVCDVDESTKVVASDALRILRAAVGQPINLHCPAT